MPVRIENTVFIIDAKRTRSDKFLNQINSVLIILRKSRIVALIVSESSTLIQGGKLIRNSHKEHR
jgi:hypothetical protein